MKFHMPDPGFLLRELRITTPVIGVYDTDRSDGFNPVVTPSETKIECLFVHYRRWQAGYTVRLHPDRIVCPGLAYWLFSRELLSREDFLTFLVDYERIRNSRDLMSEWLDRTPPYRPAGEYLFVGPLKPNRFEYLRTVTFFVTPDQLSSLLTGACTAAPADGPAAVIAPSGPGCSQLLSLFGDLNIPQAIIGATDIAMRQYLPEHLVTFTVTRTMFKRLCSLGEESILKGPFVQRLNSVRNPGT